MGDSVFALMAWSILYSFIILDMNFYDFINTWPAQILKKVCSKIPVSLESVCIMLIYFNYRLLIVLNICYI